MPTGDLACQHRSYGAMDIADGEAEVDGFRVLERGPTQFDELLVECRGDAVVLRLTLEHADPWHGWDRVQHFREVES